MLEVIDTKHYNYVRFLFKCVSCKSGIHGPSFDDTAKSIVICPTCGKSHSMVKNFSQLKLNDFFEYFAGDSRKHYVAQALFINKNSVIGNIYSNIVVCDTQFRLHNLHGPCAMSSFSTGVYEQHYFLSGWPVSYDKFKTYAPVLKQNKLLEYRNGIKFK